ncbi:MAG: hypothetical protein EOP51_24400, partial [Sphingobacteriales bacterium]
MKKIYTQSLLVLYACILFASNSFAQLSQPAISPQRSCPTFELMEDAFQKDPAARTRYNSVQTMLNDIVRDRKSQGRNTTEAVYTIPVVVHVMLPAAQQALVTDAIVLGQIDTLNYFYGAQPVGDSLRVYEPFRTSYGRSGLSFCMAQRKPDGTATNGINRVVHTNTYTAGGTHPGSVVVWDPTKYMNIWIVVFTGGTLGYSYTPGTWAPSNFRNGFVNDYRAYGSGPGTSAGGYHYNEYNRGKTAVHEIGHFFNLSHTWGPNNNGNPGCNLSDQCADTPPTSEPYFGCPSPAEIPVLDPCSPTAPGIQWQNHMDYADDACMVFFTKDQCARINASMSSPDRIGLTTSNACQPPSGFTFGTVSPTTIACPAPATASATLSTTASGGFSTPVVLTATAGVPAGTTVTFAPNPVTPGSPATVTLNNANTLSNGTYTITVTGTAGTSVQTATVSFVISSGTAPTITGANQPQSTAVCVGT